MLKKLPVQPQLEMFKTVLVSFINPQHELCLLAKEIDWSALEKEFGPLYGTTGRPSIPIRTMVGLLLLIQIYNLGDETVMERYIENPYWQHFCGEVYFQYKYPFDPSDFVHFRKRVGDKGLELIFRQSIKLFGEDNVRREVKEVRIDATVQEKNVTFPTDRKLTEKVIEHCKSIAEKENITLVRTYGREIKQLKQQLRFARKPKNIAKQRKAYRKLHRIAFKIYHDVIKQLGLIPMKYRAELDILYRVLTQNKDDKNKVYSVHEPEVLCISKGKEHKPYEFGNKSSFAYTRKSGIIVGAMAINGNIYDGRTLEPQLAQIKELTGSAVKKAIVDRGYKVAGGLPGVDIVMPKNLKRESYYLKKKREERCRSRAGIEALISHLKYDHRMKRNYLSGIAGDKINTLMAAAAYNMRKWMRLKREEILKLIFWLLSRVYGISPMVMEAR